jgi:hypothetical protein
MGTTGNYLDRRGALEKINRWKSGWRKPQSAAQKEAAMSEANEPEAAAAPETFYDKLSAARVNAEEGSRAKEGVRYDGTNFYMAVKPQLDEMFVRYPADLVLSKAVPDSKWVRVNSAEDYYCVGLVYGKDAGVEIICYAVPGSKEQKPAGDLLAQCAWLGVPDKDTNGFWVLYQSAKDGKCIEN